MQPAPKEVVDQRMAILKQYEAGEVTQYEAGQALLKTGLSLHGTADIIRSVRDSIRERKRDEQQATAADSE